MVDLREEKALERSKEKLKRDMGDHITKLFDTILDISEVAIGDPQRYKPFRAKVLRSGNDTIRELKKILDMNYKVLHVPTQEDIIEVQRQSISVKRTV